MDLVSCDFGGEVLKPRNNRNPVARRPRIDWTSVPAHGRMLVGAPARKPLRRPPPLYRPPLSRTKTKKEEDSMPNLGLWWQVLRDEREEDQERMRQLRTRIHVKEMRDMLPRLDARAVLRHRKGVAAVLEGELREDGFVQTADTISHLLELNDYLLETAQRYKLKWRVCKLRQESELLVELAKNLMEAETAKNSEPPDLKDHADILYETAKAVLLRGEHYFWLVEQLLLLLVGAVAGFRQDEGFREARARYFYGFLLAEKIGHEDFALNQLEVSRKICAGKLWTLDRLDRKARDTEFMGEGDEEEEVEKEQDEDREDRQKDKNYQNEEEEEKEDGKKEGDNIYEEEEEEIKKDSRLRRVKISALDQGGSFVGSKRSRDSGGFRKSSPATDGSVHLEYVLELRRKAAEENKRQKKHSSDASEGGSSGAGQGGGDEIETPHETLYLCVLEILVRVLVRMARATRREKPVEAVRLCSMALRRLGYTQLEHRRNTLLFELGLSYEMMHDYEMALSCFRGYVEQPEEHLELVGICSAYLEIAFCYRSLGNKEMATEYLYKVLDRSKDSDNNELIGVAHRFLGQGLLLMARYSEASDRLEEAMKLFLDLKQYEDADRARVCHGITKGYEVMPYMASLISDCEEDPQGPEYSSLLSWKLHHLPFFDIEDEKAPKLPDENLYRIIFVEEISDSRDSFRIKSYSDMTRETVMRRGRSFRFMENIIWETLSELLPPDEDMEYNYNSIATEKSVEKELVEEKEDKISSIEKWKPHPSTSALYLK